MAKFFRTVLPRTRERAEQGDMQAQFDLALFYWEGRGLKKDVDKAAAIWQELADKGHFRAMYMLGNALIRRERFREALDRFQDAAKGNDSDAMYAAGVLCYEGLVNGNPEYERAVHWFKMADEHGHKHACEFLAKMIYHGEGVLRDSVLSAYYCEKAANGGDSDSQLQLGWMNLLGIGVHKNYRLAKKWLRKAADRGDKYARYLLGLMYFRRIGVDQDYAKAKSFFERASYLSSIFEDGKLHCYAFLLTPWRDSVPDALCKLCEISAKGLGQPVDMNEAAKMYALAKERNEKKAKACLQRLNIEQRKTIILLLQKAEQEAAVAREENAKRARELRRKRHPRNVSYYEN